MDWLGDSMKNFGKFTARQGRKEYGESPQATYYDHDATGAEWHDFFRNPENKANWYLAIGDNNRICCAEKSSDYIQCEGFIIVGVDNIATYTNGEGGTIYSCRIDFSQGAILPPPLTDITKRQIKLWLLQKGKNPKKYPIEIIAKIPDETLQMQADIEWEDGDIYSRESDFIKSLAKALNWSDVALDAAWEEIASIE